MAECQPYTEVDAVHDVLCALQGVDSSLAPKIAQRLVSYLISIQEANKRVNMTAITDFKKGVTHHLVDSLQLLPWVQNKMVRNMLDVGSGGGFPGVPLGMATNKETILVDSVAKKGECVKAGLKHIGAPNFKVVSERVENYAIRHPRSVDAVVARAVSPLAILLEYAEPLLTMGGVAVFGKGCVSKEEDIGAKKVAQLLGFEELECACYTLPQSNQERTVRVFRKVGQSEVALPRRSGMATKRPLSKRKSV